MIKITITIEQERKSNIAITQEINGHHLAEIISIKMPSISPLNPDYASFMEREEIKSKRSLENLFNRVITSLSRQIYPSLESDMFQ